MVVNDILAEFAAAKGRPEDMPEDGALWRRRKH